MNSVIQNSFRFIIPDYALMDFEIPIIYEKNITYGLSIK